MKPSPKMKHDTRPGAYPSPRHFSINGVAPLPEPTFSTPLGDKFPVLPGMAADAMAKVLSLKDQFKGRSAVLVGAGPSGKQWRGLKSKNCVVVAANSVFNVIGKEADLFVCTEPSGLTYPYFMAFKDTPRVITWKALQDPNSPFTLQALELPNLYPVALSQHLAGFAPREYINPKPYTGDAYRKGDEGIAPASGLEYGLLKGPACWPGQINVGTVYLSALHMLAIMGISQVRSIGFDFCDKDGVTHWTEPGYQHQVAPGIPAAAFITVNGQKTLWHFAMSAAYCKSRIPEFEKAGMEVRDHSNGLMQMDGIESMLENIDKPPRSIHFEKTDYHALLRPPAQSPRFHAEQAASPPADLD